MLGRQVSQLSTSAYTCSIFLFCQCLPFFPHLQTQNCSSSNLRSSAAYQNANLYCRVSSVFGQHAKNTLTSTHTSTWHARSTWWQPMRGLFIFAGSWWMHVSRQTAGEGSWGCAAPSVPHASSTAMDLVQLFVVCLLQLPKARDFSIVKGFDSVHLWKYIKSK